MPLLELDTGLRVILILASYLGLFALVVHNNHWPSPWPVVVGFGGSVVLYFLLIHQAAVY